MELKDLRERLDRIDAQMTELFRQRMETVKLVADYKRENNVPILSSSREEEILNRVAGMAGEELQEYARSLFSTLMELSRDYQSALLADKAPHQDTKNSSEGL